MIIRVYQKCPSIPDTDQYKEGIIVEGIFGINYKIGILIKDCKPILIDIDSLIFVDNETDEEIDKESTLKRTDITIYGRSSNLIFDCSDWNRDGVNKILKLVIDGKDKQILKEMDKVIHSDIEDILQQIN